MTKKGNTILFIAIGTLVEVLMSFLFIIILVIAVSFFTKDNPGIAQTLFPVCLFGGVICGMFAYQKLAGWVIVKFNLEDKLDPLIPQKYRGRNRKD